ncbi:DEAD/DEAH box helicase [Rhizophagus clarus]|uniref:DEAD/DEAH box helicase n=1 Tax=Rhizophagus clarus TaxID=94130 RepID=A0A8H3QSH9_9GLOM|nr:DEAD/DEAH box helicase [Rhizophagus clarus]
MDVSLGKTRLGCAIVAYIRWPALVIIPTLAIAEQWIEEFSSYLPSLNTTIFHNADENEVTAETHDVVIVIINTFRRKTPIFVKGFGILILDEAHEYYSEYNSRALWLAQTPVVLGLSATPNERPDGMDQYVSLHVGPVIRADTIPGFDIQAVNFRRKVRAIYYEGHPDFSNTITTKKGIALPMQTIGMIIQDPHRLTQVK